MAVVGAIASGSPRVIVAGMDRLRATRLARAAPTRELRR
jgi:hypothetical protein